MNCGNTAAYDKTQILVLIILCHLHPTRVDNNISMGETCFHAHLDRMQGLEAQWAEGGLREASGEPQKVVLSVTPQELKHPCDLFRWTA